MMPNCMEWCKVSCRILQLFHEWSPVVKGEFDLWTEHRNKEDNKDKKLINNTAIAALIACTTTRLLLLSMHAQQHGYCCSQCMHNNTAIAALIACPTTRLLLLSMHALQHSILTLTSCWFQLFFLQRSNQNVFSAKWWKPNQQYIQLWQRNALKPVYSFGCIVIFYHTLLMSLIYPTPYWCHWTLCKKWCKATWLSRLMHCLCYIYNVIIHFNNVFGIFTVVTDADDKLNSVSELVNSIMLLLMGGNERGKGREWCPPNGNPGAATDYESITHTYKRQLHYYSITHTHSWQ